jgi:6-phosphogluconolactonase (cycloisomerase 2 family)
MIKRAPRLAVAIIFATSLWTTSCGKGLFQQVGSSSSSSQTQGSGGAFLYVTNLNDGTISEFKRNTKNGVLSFIATVAAGSGGGTKGIAINPTNQFLYAANVKDGTILQYAIGSDGTLTPIGSGSVSDGANSGTDTVVINPAGTLLFAADFSDGLHGDISAWTIDTTTGALSSQLINTPPGIKGPFGLAISRDGTTLYVSDNTSGTIYALSIGAGGALTNITGSPTLSQGSFAGSPSLLAIDPTGRYLIAGDLASPVIALYTFDGNGVPLFGSNTATASGQPLGVAWATFSNNTFVFSANQNSANSASGSISAFLQQPAGTLTQSNNVLAINGPSGFVIDPQTVYAYSANQGDGTVSQYLLGGVCSGQTQTICRVHSFSTKSAGNALSGPFGITLTH